MNIIKRSCLSKISCVLNKNTVNMSWHLMGHHGWQFRQITPPLISPQTYRLTLYLPVLCSRGNTEVIKSIMPLRPWWAWHLEHVKSKDKISNSEKCDGQDEPVSEDYSVKGKIRSLTTGGLVMRACDSSKRVLTVSILPYCMFKYEVYTCWISTPLDIATSNDDRVMLWTIKSFACG